MKNFNKSIKFKKYRIGVEGGFFDGERTRSLFLIDFLGYSSDIDHLNLFKLELAGITFVIYASKNW